MHGESSGSGQRRGWAGRLEQTVMEFGSERIRVRVRECVSA